MRRMVVRNKVNGELGDLMKKLDRYSKEFGIEAIVFK